MRAARGIDDGVAVALLDDRPVAALGAGVLGIDRFDRPTGGIEAVLDHLPVAGMAPRPHVRRSSSSAPKQCGAVPPGCVTRADRDDGYRRS